MADTLVDELGLKNMFKRDNNEHEEDYFPCMINVNFLKP